MKACKVGIWVGLSYALFAGAAFADPPKGHAVTLDHLLIVGRIQKPMATVEVARVEPKIALAEIRPPFTGRIERAVSRDPY